MIKKIEVKKDDNTIVYSGLSIQKARNHIIALKESVSRKCTVSITSGEIGIDSTETIKTLTAGEFWWIYRPVY